MWKGKNKAVTFSFDDGVKQDIRLIELLGKYNLKATFNINSSLLGKKTELVVNNHRIIHDKVLIEDVKNIYNGHEIAVHTLDHPDLKKLSDEDVINQVEQDRLILSDLCGYEVIGMAYPGGIFDDRVVNLINNFTGVKYSRTTDSSYNFDLQQDMLRFNPSVYYIEIEKMFDLAEKFINLKTEENKIFYIWGHSYEMDADCISWDKFEEFCKLISGKSDIFYGTNKEVILNKDFPISDSI